MVTWATFAICAKRKAEENEPRLQLNRSCVKVGEVEMKQTLGLYLGYRRADLAYPCCARQARSFWFVAIRPTSPRQKRRTSRRCLFFSCTSFSERSFQVTCQALFFIPRRRSPRTTICQRCSISSHFPHPILCVVELNAYSSILSFDFEVWFRECLYHIESTCQRMRNGNRCYLHKLLDHAGI
jgi:hypothetical protein